MRRSLGLIALALAACTAPPAPVGTPPPAASRASAVGGATASAPLAWRRLADIPTPRSEVAAAVYQQEKVYGIGGCGGPGPGGRPRRPARPRGLHPAPPHRGPGPASPRGSREPTQGRPGGCARG